MILKIAALGFLLFIFFITIAADAGQMPGVLKAMYDFPNGDRVGHVMLYGILTFLLTSAYPKRVKLGLRSIPLFSIVVLIFATVEECSQSLFASRTFDLIDLSCSCIGVLLGSLASHRWWSASEKTEQ